MRYQASDAFRLIIMVIIATIILAIFITLGSKIHQGFSKPILYPTITKSVKV